MSVSTFTDSELLQAIQQNDEKAFAELFRRYWKKVHHLTYKSVRSEEAAQEIVQDLFISLWNKRASLAIHHLPSYLYSAVKNRALNYIASQTTQKKHWDYYKRFIPVQDVVTENDVEVNELLGAIENEIEHLPEKTKKVFKLNILEGHSITDIAHTLNLSEKAIQYHLTQSIKKVRFHLKNFILVLLLACLG
ncbi:RNA polymerase sigma-70 factor [Fulvivirgaceae bacterium PWU4]|uniref:RNA polymerase sigma-70 factor n=1 Tax=Chryseosolibacter histidini TaxID=2782349 RepID=A0AAP2GPX5_9BACT|nr:RNA polymerase sigma-70 factor [Chryseosolibacter histidini]MBT1698395.1 RNA polymerase sigma-70 factor [Chryseosolibacter histidini]